jgi:NAD(P)-dependent dehydrogenase (short-subunit alcohol dehydrogenase family)
MARVSVISGGATGIGKAIAARLAKDGDQVVLLGRRLEALEKAAAEITGAAAGDPVRWYRADLSEPDQVAAAASAIVRDHGSVDVLVNNAGGVSTAATDTLAELAAAWRQDFDGNVLPTVLLTEALLPHITRPGGRIVAISSVAALRGAGSYGGAKAALHAWAYSLADELAPDGVTVNVVAPGFVPDTEFWAGRLTPQVYESRVARIPMGRPGTPAEVAAAVCYLVSPNAGWTTGQVLQVNGGTLLGRG